ncbi:hypothetical protein J3R30DRAFT_3484398 [Lentinula aciculospora]|uniref:Cytochrome P450 n=1 Tax=Lentinula aciculospora TaxID=153920 RepID=A0A9W9DMI7_9AGAR|nr:hypothetical protein J3R30DRAFT_3484398 [Lentinula aciculospora]
MQVWPWVSARLAPADCGGFFNRVSSNRSFRTSPSREESFGGFLVDLFSVLKYLPSWFPGASFKRKARAWYGIRQATITPPFVQVKQAMANGIEEDYFNLRCLKNVQNADPRPDHLSEEEDVIKQTAGTMYQGGADTGITALRTFLLAMMCFPNT